MQSFSRTGQHAKDKRNEDGNVVDKKQGLAHSEKKKSASHLWREREREKEKNKILENSNKPIYLRTRTLHRKPKSR